MRCSLKPDLVPDLDSIRALCRSFPDVQEDMPWPDDLCFKVRGKIFVGLALSEGRFPHITLKASPEAFHELLETEGIAPAAYVGRYKWVTLSNPNVVDARRLEELIRKSYELVSSKVRREKKKRKKKKRKKKTTNDSMTR